MQSLALNEEGVHTKGEASRKHAGKDRARYRALHLVLPFCVCVLCFLIFMIKGAGCGVGVWGLGFMVEGLWCMVYGLWVMGYGLWVMVCD